MNRKYWSYDSYCNDAVGIIVVHYKMDQCKLWIQKIKSIKSILTMKDNQGNNIYIGSNNVAHKIIEPYYHAWYNRTIEI